MYTIYEYESDPLLNSTSTSTLTTTTTTTINQNDISTNEILTSSSTSPSTTTTTVVDALQISNNNNNPKPNSNTHKKKEYQIRLYNNNKKQMCHDNNDNNTVSTTTMSSTTTTTKMMMIMMIECIPVETIQQQTQKNEKNNSSKVGHRYNNNNNILFLYQYMISIYHIIKQIFIDLLLPYQYPISVRNGYIQYQIYDSIQGLCSYLRNIVCSAALFQAMVIMNQNQNNNNNEDGTSHNDGNDGNSSSSSSVSSTAWNAAIIWAIRDGTGLIGSLFYTYMVSSYLDAYVKEFRFFADIINDIGFTLDMILPYIDDPNNSNTTTTTTNTTTTTTHTTLFWIISSLSVLCKMMCGISAGATKSSITAHFAIQGNMADLNAKESTQETMVTLMGMIGGIYIAKLLQSLEENGNNNNSRFVTWIFFIVLTLIHIYANYLGVSLLQLRTINTSRIDPCLQKLYTSTSLLLPETVVQESILYTSSTNNNYNNDVTTSKVETTLLQQQQHYDNLRTLLLSTIVSPTEIHEIMFLPVWEFLGIIVQPSSYMMIYCNTIPQYQLQSYFHQSLLGQLLLSLHGSNDDDDNNNDSSSTDSSQNDMTTTILSSLYYNITIMMTNHNTKNTTTLMRRHLQKKKKQPKVAITLLTGATSKDEFQAYLHAKIIVILLLQLQQQKEGQELLDDQNTISIPFNKLSTLFTSSEMRHVLLDSYKMIQSLFQQQQPTPNIEPNETNILSGATPSSQEHATQHHLPLILDILQQKDWDISRFYFNYPPRRCQLVWNNSTETPLHDDNEIDIGMTNKKDD